MKHTSKSVDGRLTSSTPYRPTPRRPPPYLSGRKPHPHPHLHPALSLSSSSSHHTSPEKNLTQTVSDSIDGSRRFLPTSPPSVPKKTTLSVTSTRPTSAVGDQGKLTSSISSQSLHLRSSSPSKPANLNSSCHLEGLKSPPTEQGESSKVLSSYHVSPSPRRPAPPRPLPFVQSHSTSRAAPPPPPPLPPSGAASISSSAPASPEISMLARRRSRGKGPSEVPSVVQKEAKDLNSPSASGSNFRKKVISGPVLKSTTISLTGSQPIVSSDANPTPERAAAPSGNPASVTTTKGTHPSRTLPLTVA